MKNVDDMTHAEYARAVHGRRELAPDAARCWHFLHTYGVQPIRCSVTPDYHDGPHAYDRKDDPR